MHLIPTPAQQAEIMDAAEQLAFLASHLRSSSRSLVPNSLEKRQVQMAGVWGWCRLLDLTGNLWRRTVAYTVAGIDQAEHGMDLHGWLVDVKAKRGRAGGYVEATEADTRHQCDLAFAEVVWPDVYLVGWCRPAVLRSGERRQFNTKHFYRLPAACLQPPNTLEPRRPRCGYRLTRA